MHPILDIFSSHVVGWLIAERESAELAEQLIADSVARHDIEPGILARSAQRGQVQFEDEHLREWVDKVARQRLGGPGGLGGLTG